MPLLSYKGEMPIMGKEVFIAPSGYVIGRVTVGWRTGIWFSTVVRGDMDSVKIGEETNIQDNVTVHTDFGEPVSIGSRVTVGHNAVLHSCTVEDGALIGMGSVVMNNAVIGKDSLVAAGSLVPPGKEFPPRSLVMGSPAKLVRTLTEEEIPEKRGMYRNYLELARTYLNE